MPSSLIEETPDLEVAIIAITEAVLFIEVEETCGNFHITYKDIDSYTQNNTLLQDAIKHMFTSWSKPTGLSAKMKEFFYRKEEISDIKACLLY
uniref:DUF727 domain-containing protein n=1 Tax=Heterorhabditis bacteriophora TaxID=37862 RepID=A0A1I7XKQ5_HETBA